MPLSDRAQQEARDPISIAAHLQRDPETVLDAVIPSMDALWSLSFAADMTRPRLHESLRAQLSDTNASAVLDDFARLYADGFAAITASGASVNPFIGGVLASGSPQLSDTDDGVQLMVEAEERLISRGASDPLIGPQVRAVVSGARGNETALRRLISHGGLVEDAGRITGPVPAIAAGRPWPAFVRSAAGARRGLATSLTARMDVVTQLASEPTIEGYNVIARARRSPRLGAVFAAATARGERDPLTDAGSRAWLGVER